MSNKVSTHLFDLIKSLNKSEKRYFKVFSSRHTIGEENSYIRLFDFIDRMEDYQEDLIFMHFKGQALLNKFSITKARLYDNILKSLDTFYASSSHDAQIFRAIHSADILYNKGLYKQSERILNSAEKQAIKHGNYHLLLEIKEKQKRLIENDMYRDIKADQITKMYEEELDIIKNIETYHQLWHVKSLLFQEINFNGKIRDEEGKEKLKELLAQINELNVDKARLKSKYLYHHIHSAYYFSVNQLDKSYEHLKENIRLIEADKTFIKDQPNIYFSLLTNITYVATKLRDYEAARDFLSKLKDVSPKGSGQANMDLDIKYFSSTTSLELFLLIEQANFEKAEKMIPQIEEAYRLYGDNINSLRKAYIDFKLGVVYLSIGKYNEALHWINQILNENKIDQKQDIYCFAQLLNLLIHLELNNDRFLPYALNSTKRYLKNRNRIYRFEELFLKLIGQMSKADNIFDLQEKLEPVEKELAELKKDPKEEVVFEYFDFHIWIQAKIKQESFLTMKQRELQEAT